mgnify:CR=1 FL=1|tara:strand:- start:3941 stop:9091 length:5151 start_codon:yes stop_codon:yes gene_type:complete
MLSGEPAPAIGGRITKIQAQVSALDWQIEDLLVTAAHDDGVQARLAISVKGNQQVSASGLPADFVELAWKQWRDATGPMGRGKDGLALVKRGAHPIFDQNWPEVKNACSGSDAALAVGRMRGAPKQSAIFDSVRKAAGTPSDATDEEAVELIRHLHVLSSDFQLGHSEWKSQAVAQCRQLITSGDLTQAEMVWTALIKVASKVRIESGTVSLTELWGEFRKQYSLRDHPDFARDWRTLADLTADYKARNVQTTFSTGYSVALSDEKAKFSAAIRANLVTVVMGESGIGKSALAKSTLDGDFEGWTQVWLGPDELRSALSAARRRALPLEQELGRVLNASSNARNVLVLDSTERIDPAEFNTLRQFLKSILPETADAVDAAWRVVVVTQTQGWTETSEIIPDPRKVNVVELEALKQSAVKAALRATPSLGWLTAHDETVAVLANLRILAWVVKAGAALGSNARGLASHSDIADRLWDYWTGGAADVQSIMMRLSEREAQFERSFALSELNPADATTFANRPATLPLRLNKRTNRIEFEHDLAADWARFQYLKQMADNTTTWAALAENPLWTNALRMLGQFLLRQAAGASTAWDQALEQAKASNNALAGDLLLDALSLDPEAERLLSERVDLLLANEAKLLKRLLMRFQHIGTIPMASLANVDTSLGLYMEARFRTVIVGRWPPVLRFLIAHREQLESLASLAVVKLLETWLVGTPKELPGGMPMPFRKEAAEMVLAMARTVQVHKGHGVMYLMDDLSLYTAPLASAGDLTDQVSAWALELSGRRKVDSDVAVRIKAERSAEAKRYADRLENDAAFRKTEQERKNRSFPAMIGSSRERLPPWPLGARERIDHDFRKAAFKDNGLLQLMQAAPAVAAEVLLALIIDDEPYFDSGSSRHEIELGLEFAENGYPTMYWKSPFFIFLQVAENEALGALIALVNFCTERWCDVVGQDHEDPPVGVTLQMNDGSTKLFAGSSEVFGWVQSTSNHSGNLFCALDALERWLTVQLDAGVDLTPQIERLLAEGSSSAFIGLLANVAKYRPELLAGPLAPILTDPLVFYWDDERVANTANRFDAYHWVRSGEAVFEMAKDWGLAPHRAVKLLPFATELIKTNTEIATRLTKLIPTWRIPTDPIQSLEFKVIFAGLNRVNYSLQSDAKTGEEVLVFHMPVDLARELAASDVKSEKPRKYSGVPAHCEDLLRNQQDLSERDARKLLDLLKEVEAANDIEAHEKATCLLALAAALIVTGEAVLASDQELHERVQSVVRKAIGSVGATAEAIRSMRVGYGNAHMKFATYAAMHLWMKRDSASDDWERLVLTLLTSGNHHVFGTIIAIAYFYRDRLADAWWRLLYAGLLWSALVLLAPHQVDEDEGKLWAIWLQRLRRFRLLGVAASLEDLDVMRVAKAYEQLDYSRQLRVYASGDPRRRGAPERRWSTGLDWDVLAELFSWLTNGSGTGDWTRDSVLAVRLWEHEIERQKARRKDDEGSEYGLPSQSFGYDILAKLAELSVTAPGGYARRVWEPVLSHGPAAHHALGQFIRDLFQQLKKGCDRAAFERVWRETIEYALDAEWGKRVWYRGEELLCSLLGFSHESYLDLLPPGAQTRMRDVYERWAKNHLGSTEEGVERFSTFLSTDFGGPLRLDGLRWIAAAFKDRSQTSRWHRNRTGDALIELLNTAINQNSSELATDPSARQALVEIAGALAIRSNPTALALQERIKRLR